MHLYEKKKRGFHGIFRTLVVFAAMILIFIFVLTNTGNTAGDRSEQIVKQAITKAAVTCYTLEGAYPENLQYLIDNYGLIINTDKYIVIYETNGPNLMPRIAVLPK